MDVDVPHNRRSPAVEPSHVAGRGVTRGGGGEGRGKVGAAGTGGEHGRAPPERVRFGKASTGKAAPRHVEAQVLVEGRRGPIVRHRVAARASREWPRGEKRKGSPRVAPPAAGGGKSLLRGEQVLGPARYARWTTTTTAILSTTTTAIIGHHHAALPRPMASLVSPSPQLRPASRAPSPIPAVLSTVPFPPDRFHRYPLPLRRLSTPRPPFSSWQV